MARRRGPVSRPTGATPWDVAMMVLAGWSATARMAVIVVVVGITVGVCIAIAPVADLITIVRVLAARSP